MEPQETIVSTEPDRKETIARDLTHEAADLLTDLHRIVERLHVLFDERRLDRPPEPPLYHAGTPAPPVSPAAVACLTARERDVLGLLVQGLSNRRIARVLQISEPTVKNHLHAIFVKLRVTDRTQAMAKVLGTCENGPDAVPRGDRSR